MKFKVHLGSKKGRRWLWKMRAGVLWFISFFTFTEGHCSHLGQRNDGIKTKRTLRVDEKKYAGQEYELLLQVTYRNSKEKRDLEESFQKLLKSPLSCWHGPTQINRVKATTHCGSLNGGLRCACEDGYTWFSPSCLDPQNCYLRTTGSLPSCECHLNNLNLSVNFCERAKVWGTFKINERFSKDLLNSSSVIYSKYTTEIEHQLKEVFKEIQSFESVQVTQFREGSIIVGYEVIGSSNTSELLSAIEQLAEKAKAALGKVFPLEDSSFRVSRKVQCDSISFGFGFENDEYVMSCSSGYTGNITARCLSSGWQVIRESCVLFALEELQKNFSVIAGNVTESDVSSVVQNLSTIIQQSPSTTVGNLASVVSILSNVSSLSLAKHFKVSNSTLTGFFIFCFGILLDTKLRQLLFNKLLSLSSGKQTLKQNSSDVALKPRCLKPLELLQNKGSYSLSHTGESSTNITLTQFLSNE